MPSTLSPIVSREIFAWKFWRNSSQLQHVRSRSTAQSIKTWEDDSGASTFLYSGNFGRAVIGKQPTASNPRVSPEKSPQQASRVDNGRARTIPAIHSAPRQDKDILPPSQDENFVQDQRDFPTPENYPDVPSSVFTEPKGSIWNTLQGRADFKAEFTQHSSHHNRPETYQCTLTCVFRQSHESIVGIGRGLNKVGLADRLMNSLTVPRNPPTGLHTKIYYIGSTRTGSSTTSSQVKRASSKIVLEWPEGLMPKLISTTTVLGSIVFLYLPTNA